MPLDRSPLSIVLDSLILSNHEPHIIIEAMDGPLEKGRDHDWSKFQGHPGIYVPPADTPVETVLHDNTSVFSHQKFKMSWAIINQVAIGYFILKLKVLGPRVGITNGCPCQV